MTGAAKALILLLNIIILLTLSSTIEGESVEKLTLNRGGESTDVITNPSISNLRDEIENHYSGKDDLLVYQSPVSQKDDGRGGLETIFEYNVPIRNMKQSTMNYEFNEYHGRDIGNSCTAVAVAMLMNYYGDDLNQFQIYNRYLLGYPIESELWQLFGGVYELGRSYNFIEDDQSGTYNTDHSTYIDATFSAFNSPNRADSSYNVYWLIQNETSEGRPVMFNLTNHTMVARGYVTFTVSYTETTGWGFWKSTETIYEDVDYIIVNHGWDDGYEQYGYHPASETTTSNLIYNAQSIND